MQCLITMNSSFNISSSLLFLCILICCLSLRIKATPTFVDIFCPQTQQQLALAHTNATSTPSSSLSSNSTSINGFFYSYASLNPLDIAYGCLLCRGDVSTTVCQNCVSFATRDVLQKCPNSKVVTIWYDECMLRYSNQSIIDIADESIISCVSNTLNITNLTSFRGVLGGLMDDIVTRASNGRSSKKFTMGQANFSFLQTLYGLAQFTPDLIVLDCNKCLGISISIIPSSFDGSLDAEVLFSSCNVRYEFYRFYNVTDTSPPPSPVLLPPRPRPASSPVGDEMSTAQSLQFDLGTIQVTTSNFSYDNKIGEGGFGSVYKVMYWI
ncbi:hypothetical protein TEA_017772 [Camellia sinensis var. sinensis]|uniref:Gnk2-homologous domain-containing protein n=1 Tax=Camellia sinensis var. sinensis TaxID=542762 RepID=A0A4S4DQZ6_CAMSN|nr:hypothetical protein TEA_017772 [Camellia sinensis var. sinensis]